MLRLANTIVTGSKSIVTRELLSMQQELHVSECQLQLTTLGSLH